MNASSGACTALNPYCATSDLSNGNCLSCYNGYSLSQGNCVIQATVTIPFCSITQGSTCIQCIQNYYLSNGKCNAVSTLCLTYDQNTGNCTSCIPGYFYQQNQCIFPSLGIDPLCTFYTNSYCTQCQSGSYLSNFVCNVVDPNCSMFDYNALVCKVCANGKFPNGPACI